MVRGWLTSLLFGAPGRPLPPSPLVGMASSSAAECAAALLSGWREQVPDCVEVPPRDDFLEDKKDIPRIQLAALSSPRLTDEQVLVEWLPEDGTWGNSAVWIKFPGITVEPGEIERAVEWDMSVAFWTGVGLLRNGVRYGRNRLGRARAFIFVDEAASWAVLGVHEPLGLEHDWVIQPRLDAFRHSPAYPIMRTRRRRRSCAHRAAIQDVARRKTGVYFQPFSNPLGTTRVMPYRLFGRADERSDRRHEGASLPESRGVQADFCRLLKPVDHRLGAPCRLLQPLGPVGGLVSMQISA